MNISSPECPCEVSDYGGADDDHHVLVNDPASCSDVAVLRSCGNGASVGRCTSPSNSSVAELRDESGARYRTVQVSYAEAAGMRDPAIAAASAIRSIESRFVAGLLSTGVTVTTIAPVRGSERTSSACAPDDPDASDAFNEFSRDSSPGSRG